MAGGVPSVTTPGAVAGTGRVPDRAPGAPSSEVTVGSLCRAGGVPSDDDQGLLTST